MNLHAVAEVGFEPQLILQMSKDVLLFSLFTWKQLHLQKNIVYVAFFL